MNFKGNESDRSSDSDSTVTNVSEVASKIIIFVGGVTRKSEGILEKLLKLLWKRTILEREEKNL